MNLLNEVVNYILSFKSYVMLPVLMFIVCMLVKIKVQKAFTYCLTLGIGFIGIFMIFDFFVSKIGPVVDSIVKRTGSDLNVLDVGWPPMAAIAWSFKWAPVLILLIILGNAIMLLLKKTSTVNIDIWNYWHFIFTAQLVYFFTRNIILAILACLFIMVLVVKLGDWSVYKTQKMSGIKGISITTLSGVAYYPFALLVDKVIDFVPGINKINADPENIRKRLGFFGESMFIGFAMGIGLGIAAGYNLKAVLDLAFSIAAVVFILPRMSGILGEGLIPISNSTKEFLLKKFPTMKDSNIGMDLAVVMGNPAIIVTGILLMPIALILALTLPGMKFIPLGDLPNMMGAIVMVVIACRGNIVRSIIASVPIIIGKLYVASALAGTYTTLAKEAGVKTDGYSGLITSFLDGGNLFRTWVVYLFSGKLWAIILLPLVAASLFYTWKVWKKESAI